MFTNELMMTGNPEQVASTLDTLTVMQGKASDYGDISTKMVCDKEITAYANEALITNIYADTAILTISGMLIPNYSWMERYADVVSYDSIRAAVITLLEDEEITKVIVVVESPGGYARGCGVTADMLFQLGELKKFSACYTETTMDSAGYWLGSALPLVTCSKYALVGSVGAYTTYSTRFRMLEEMGVDSYIARSGTKKGVPSGIEPLSDLDKTVIDDRNEAQAALFLEAVRNTRNGKLSTDEWHSGESFSATKAVTLGLVDDIVTLPDLINTFKNIEIN